MLRKLAFGNEYREFSTTIGDIGIDAFFAIYCRFPEQKDENP
jgi:hypothetical protein